jgi:hypothetical protein
MSWLFEHGGFAWCQKDCMVDFLLQVAYIDTEGTFRAEKVRAIAARYDLDADAVLENVRKHKPWSQCNLWDKAC